MKFWLFTGENQNEAILTSANNIEKKNTQVKNTKIRKALKMLHFTLTKYSVVTNS